jgi:predicted dehydrogenase
MVHHIDTARFLFGDIQSVYAEAMRVNPRIQGEDHAILTLRHVEPVMGWADGHSFASLDQAGPSIDEAIFEGQAGSIRVSAAGEIWSGHTKIWTQDFSIGYRGDCVYPRWRTSFNAFRQTGLSKQRRANTLRRRSP